jgi:hypothetical protein
MYGVQSIHPSNPIIMILGYSAPMFRKLLGRGTISPGQDGFIWGEGCIAWIAHVYPMISWAIADPQHP